MSSRAVRAGSKAGETRHEAAAPPDHRQRPAGNPRRSARRYLAPRRRHDRRDRCLGAGWRRDHRRQRRSRCPGPCRSRRIRDRQTGVSFRRDHSRGADARPVPAARSAEPRVLHRQEREARFLGASARCRDTRARWLRDRRTGSDARSGRAGRCHGAPMDRGFRRDAALAPICRHARSRGGRACRRCRAGRQRGGHRRRNRHAARLAECARASGSAGPGARHRACRNGASSDPFPSGDDPRGPRIGARGQGPRRAGDLRRHARAFHAERPRNGRFQDLRAPLAPAAQRRGPRSCARSDCRRDDRRDRQRPRSAWPRRQAPAVLRCGTGHGGRRDIARDDAVAGPRRCDRLAPRLRSRCAATRGDPWCACRGAEAGIGSGYRDY